MRLFVRNCVFTAAKVGECDYMGAGMKQLLFVLLTITCSVSSAKWTVADLDHEKGEYDFVDKDTIRRDGNLAKMWVMTRWVEPQKDVWGRFDEATMLVLYDCYNEKSQLLSLTYRLKSEPVFTADVSPKWSFLQPGTVGYRRLSIACGRE